MFLLFATFARAACPVTPAGLAADVDRVERAFAALDAPGVAAAGARLDEAAACLDATVDPALAVRVHAAHGLVAFVAGDAERAAAAFAAARRVDPAWAPDLALVPKGHPIRALSRKLDPASLGATPMPAPARGELVLDGRVARERPAETPVLAQWVVDRRVVSSGYTWPDAPLPPYDTAAVSSGERGKVGGWLAVTGGGLVASAASFYLAGNARDTWEDADTGRELVSSYRANHVLWGLGAGFGVVAAVGGVGALATVAF